MQLYAAFVSVMVPDCDICTTTAAIERLQTSLWTDVSLGRAGMGGRACMLACMLACMRACMSYDQVNMFSQGNRDHISVPQGNSLMWRCAPDGYLMGSLPGD